MEHTLNLLLAAEVLKLATDYQNRGARDERDALIVRAYDELTAVNLKIQDIERQRKSAATDEYLSSLKGS